MAPRSEITRQRLLDAATAELIERDGTLEVGGVAVRAGVSTGALYHHFGSKAGLLTAVVRDYNERMHTHVIVPDLVELGDWAAREHARIERMVAFHYGDPLAPVLATLAREPEVAAAEAPLLAELVGAAERNLRAAQRDGEISSEIDPGITAAMIMGGVDAVLAQVLTRRKRPEPALVAEELWRLVSAAVRPVQIEQGVAQ
jgi:AcrR family transcriptional regulator